jgi:prepilin-type N-terminal cleavage/methylation domain-containing protein
MTVHTKCAVEGFTLIEIAIVLVIVGLTVGGIYAGITLKRSSELQSIMTDKNKYVEAVNQFKEKYGFLPGDFPNASTYWTAPSGGCAGGSCNGDGNGQICGNANTAGSGETNAMCAESYLAWWHLSQASMIDGSYTGNYGASGYIGTPGTNIPASRLPNAGFSIYYLGPSNSSNYYQAAYRHVMVLGAPVTTATSSYLDIAAYPIMAAADALALDTKYDDGLPAQGAIMAFKNGSSYAPSCANSSAAISAAYNVTANANVKCSLIFLMDF